MLTLPAAGDMRRWRSAKSGAGVECWASPSAQRQPTPEWVKRGDGHRAFRQPRNRQRENAEPQDPKRRVGWADGGSPTIRAGRLGPDCWASPLAQRQPTPERIKPGEGCKAIHPPRNRQSGTANPRDRTPRVGWAEFAKPNIRYCRQRVGLRFRSAQPTARRYERRRRPSPTSPRPSRASTEGAGTDLRSSTTLSIPRRFAHTSPGKQSPWNTTPIAT